MNAENETSLKYICEPCDYKCCKPNDWQRHISTAKHEKRTFSDTKSDEKYACDTCDYKCSRKSLFDKHLLTDKHGFRVSATKKTAIYTCTSCNKDYKHYTSLWSHSKVCKPIEANNPIIQMLISENKELRNLIIEQANEHNKETANILNKVVEQNNETKNMVVEIMKSSTNNTIVNNTNTNSNNKFNVNVFLDTECKDAMNFEDFVNGIEVSQEDIQNNGRLGFVDGISKIIMDNLNRLSVHQRPIHCTDWKREVLYIKDDNKWTKETDAKKIRDAIQVVSQKSIRTLHAWKMSNPDYKRGSSDFAMECIDMQLHSVAGEKREVYYPKVAKLVARHVLLDKKG
jgi:hypothetical protein